MDPEHVEPRHLAQKSEAGRSDPINDLRFARCGNN
jgi:hypothetical protein